MTTPFDSTPIRRGRTGPGRRPTRATGNEDVTITIRVAPSVKNALIDRSERRDCTIGEVLESLLGLTPRPL